MMNDDTKITKRPDVIERQPRWRIATSEIGWPIGVSLIAPTALDAARQAVMRDRAKPASRLDHDAPYVYVWPETQGGKVKMSLGNPVAPDRFEYAEVTDGAWVCRKPVVADGGPDCEKLGCNIVGSCQWPSKHADTPSMHLTRPSWLPQLAQESLAPFACGTTPGDETLSTEDRETFKNAIRKCQWCEYVFDGAQEWKPAIKPLRGICPSTTLAPDQGVKAGGYGTPATATCPECSQDWPVVNAPDGRGYIIPMHNSPLRATRMFVEVRDAALHTTSQIRYAGEAASITVHTPYGPRTITAEELADYAIRVRRDS